MFDLDPPVIAIGRIIVRDNHKTKDFYECTIELDKNCLLRLGNYVNEVVPDAKPLTPEDLGFFIQGIFSNIVKFQEHSEIKACSYIAGKRVLYRSKSYK